jgi:hypothetical protein
MVLPLWLSILESIPFDMETNLMQHWWDQQNHLITGGGEKKKKLLLLYCKEWSSCAINISQAQVEQGRRLTGMCS